MYLGPTCLCERGHIKKKAKNASVVFILFPRDGRVGHVLVLVFAATRKDSALQAARVIERAVSHVAFFRNAICKSIVYGIISDGHIETKRISI